MMMIMMPFIPGLEQPFSTALTLGDDEERLMQTLIMVGV